MSMTTKNAKIEPEKHIWMVEIFPVFLGRRQGDRLKNTRRRRPIGHKRQLQMIDNPIHDGNLRDEGDDLHPAPKFRNFLVLDIDPQPAIDSFRDGEYRF